MKPKSVSKSGRCVGAMQGFTLPATVMGRLLCALHPTGPGAQKWDEQPQPSQDTLLGLGTCAYRVKQHAVCLQGAGEG